MHFNCVYHKNPHSIVVVLNFVFRYIECITVLKKCEYRQLFVTRYALLVGNRFALMCLI